MKKLLKHFNFVCSQPITITLLLVLTGCYSQTGKNQSVINLFPYNIKAVGISMYGKAGGSAHFTVNADLSAMGSHLTPGPNPFVHQQTGTVPTEVVHEIYKLSAAVLNQGLRKNPVNNSQTYIMVSIVDSDGKIHVFQQRAETEAESAELDKLIKLLIKNSIGW